MSGGRRPVEITAESITKVVLPIIYGGTSLTLLAVLRKSKDPAVREMGVALAATAAAGSTLPPSALATFEHVLGDANYGRFLSQLGTVVAAGAGNGVLVRSAYPHQDAEPKVRARHRRMLGTLALMGTLFARDRALAAELQLPTNHVYDPIPALYWVAFSDFMVEAAGETAQLALRASRLTRDESLRNGLRCLGAGTSILAGFYGQYAAGLIGRMVSDRFPGPLRGVPAQAIIGTGAAAVALGTSLPGVTWRLHKAWQAVHDARLCAALTPVWAPFAAAEPHNTLVVGRLRDHDVRLHRRVMETLDGLDRVASRRDPRGRFHEHAVQVGQQHNLTGDDLTALERAALVRYESDRPASLAEQDVDDLHGPAGPLTGGTVHPDYRHEARRLLQAARYLQHSPLPEAVATLVRTAMEQDERTYPMATTTPDRAAADSPGCTCLERGTDEVGYLEYAVGRAACDKFIEDERAQCAVHGTAAPAETPA